jgi:TRAP-type C4-dicarboxylate transport system permease small subunit
VTVGRLAGLLARAEDALLVLLLSAMVLLAGGQILLRNVLDAGLVWADPLLRVLVLWVGMAGAMAAARADRHITVDVLSRLLPERARRRTRALTDLATAAACALLAWHAARFVAAELAGGAIAFAGVPAWVCQLILPVGFGVMALRYLALGIGRARGGGGPSP